MEYKRFVIDENEDQIYLSTDKKCYLSIKKGKFTYYDHDEKKTYHKTYRVNSIWYMIFIYLIKNNGKLITLQEIFDNVINDEAIDDPEMKVKTNIKEIHKKDFYKYCDGLTISIHSAREYVGKNVVILTLPEQKNIFQMDNFKEKKRIASGFETSDFYKNAIEMAQYRLWIWGRKNKKLFDRSNMELLCEISEKIKSEKFSFRVLFLSPDTSEDILRHAQKKKNFSRALVQSISDAVEVMEECAIGLNSIKFYSGKRNAEIIIVDDYVLFSETKFDENGKVQHFTNAPFEVAGKDNRIGMKYIDEFDTCWSKAKKLQEIESRW